MAKIIINEIDKTRAGSGAYQNFSIVVPGYCGKTVAEGIFDENGIYEVSSQTEFVRNIGKYEQEASLTAEGPTLTKFNAVGEQQPVFTGKVDANDYYGTYKGCMYTFIPAAPDATIGKLIGTIDGDNLYQFTLSVDDWDATVDYAYIKKGDEGKDKHLVTDRGNQMAFELLGLGYTVLFKKLDDDTEWTDDDTTLYKGLKAMRTASFWEALKDKTNYDFRFITTGGYVDKQSYEQIAKVAKFIKGEDTLEKNITNPQDIPGRGDCTALMDVPEENLTDFKGSQSKLIQAIKAQVATTFENQAIDRNSRIFIPEVKFNFSDSFYVNDQMPGSFYYLACAAKALQNYREWYATAGYQRGICDLIVKGTTLNLGDIAQNALTPRTTKSGDTFRKAINVIINIHNNYYLWGNRTAHIIEESGLIASDYANIRELCTTIKKAVFVACKQLTFNPNSDLLWVDFRNKIRPLLETMKTDQGIRDYKFVKIPTDLKGVLKGKIRIVPIEAVEDFEIDLFLEDSLTGVSASTDEVESN